MSIIILTSYIFLPNGGLCAAVRLESFNIQFGSTFSFMMKNISES